MIIPSSTIVGFLRDLTSSNCYVSIFESVELTLTISRLYQAFGGSLFHP